MTTTSTATSTPTSTSASSRPVATSFLLGKNRPTGALFSGSRPVGALFQKDPTSPSAAKPEPPKAQPQPDPVGEIFSSLLAFRRPADRHRSASHETGGKGKSMDNSGKRDSPQGSSTQASTSQVRTVWMLFLFRSFSFFFFLFLSFSFFFVSDRILSLTII